MKISLNNHLLVGMFLGITSLVVTYFLIFQNSTHFFVGQPEIDTEETDLNTDPKPDKNEDLLVSSTEQVENKYIYNLKNKPCTEVLEPISTTESGRNESDPDSYAYEYSVHDNCFYYKNEAVYEHNLYYQISSGEFGEIPQQAKMGDTFGEQPIQELFRYEYGDKLRIFLSGGADCGGCILTDPYLEITLSTGEISRKMADLPYFYNLKLSPDKKRAILVEIEYPEQNESGEVVDGMMKEEYYLYDLINFKKGKKLYSPRAGELTLLSCGMGCMQSGVEWLDNQFIQLTPRKLTELDIPYVGYPDEQAAYDKPFVVPAF